MRKIESGKGIWGVGKRGVEIEIERNEPRGVEIKLGGGGVG